MYKTHPALNGADVSVRGLGGAPTSYDDENPAWRYIIVNSVFNALAILVVVFRLVSRRITRAGFGWDDGLIVISTVMVNAMLVVSGFLIALGFGLPVHEVRPENLMVIKKLGQASRYLFIFSVCFIKISALCFYIRVFGTRVVHDSNNARLSLSSTRSNTSTKSYKQTLSNTLRPFIRPSNRRLYLYVIGLVILWTMANLVQELVICGFRKYEKNMCPQQRESDLSMCVFNAVGDLLILVLPIFPIWRLQMKKSTKIGLSLVFGLGTVTTVVAFFRFVSITETQYGDNYNYTALKSKEYAILEANLAILCISLPMIQPLLRLVRARFQRRPAAVAENVDSVTMTSPGGVAQPRVRFQLQSPPGVRDRRCGESHTDDNERSKSVEFAARSGSVGVTVTRSLRPAMLDEIEALKEFVDSFPGEVNTTITAGEEGK